jgi:hypothetical protein
VHTFPIPLQSSSFSQPKGKRLILLPFEKQRLFRLAVLLYKLHGAPAGAAPAPALAEHVAVLEVVDVEVERADQGQKEVAEKSEFFKWIEYFRAPRLDPRTVDRDGSGLSLSPTFSFIW